MRYVDRIIDHISTPIGRYKPYFNPSSGTMSPLVQIASAAVHRPRINQPSIKPLSMEQSPDPTSNLSVLIQQAVDSARAFLKANARCLKSITNTGVCIEENFAQLLMQEVVDDMSLVDVKRSPRLYNFFKKGGELTTAIFPCDLDTTSVGLRVFGPQDSQTLEAIMNQMLEHRDENGIVQVYFDKSRQRTDPVVCLNVLTLFYKYGRGSDLNETLQYAYGVLRNRGYTYGTRYYQTAEVFLYFAVIFTEESGSEDIRKKWTPLLRVRLMELILTGSKSVDPLSTAIRILLSTKLELASDPVDVYDLLRMRNKNGSWTGGWFYKYGSSGILIENAGFTTAIALKALTTLKNMT
ncbi:hypothetical protein BDZ94DRAFT_1294279 [Collybia nuda]|uniref:Uncharacterized protein n=1 Tax=Collybia nuda TaxID=64659 RepID=A0A9P6CNX8_9AGAR|nr:hypothetical protein BDZ94DRAFT_1294279 [Collybia nuda]